MPRSAVPSGLACMHCFKSKCKCVTRAEGDGCERCFRLKKQCRPSDSVRKTANAQRREHSSARIGALEGKVNSLVRVLSILAQSPAFADTFENVSEPLFQPDEQAGWTSGTPNTAPEGNENTEIERSAARSTSPSTSSPHGGELAMNTLPNSSIIDHEVSRAQEAEAEACLKTFREKLLPSFSFIQISPDATARQLQRDRPFLMRAIMAVATPFKRQKVAHGRELKEALAQVALVQNQSSIDLLCGVMVFTAWGYDHMHSPPSTPSRLIVLAISLACDLHLDKPLPSDEHMMKPMVDDAYEQEINKPKNGLVAEERRAVLACFALSSIISIYFAQIDAMRWKPQMEESLRAIESNTECPEDVAFAFHVRLQLLAQKAVHFREQREWDYARMGSNAVPPHSANFYIQTLHTQLQQLGDTLPPLLQERGTLIMHKHYIELCVNETARSMYLHTTSIPMQNSRAAYGSDVTDPNSDSSFDFDELYYAWRSIGAIKSWMDAFFSISPAECVGLSFVHIAQLARCLVVLYRLSTLVHPGWDCNLVCRELDILTVLDNVAKKFQLASRDAGEQAPDDQFNHLAAQMQTFRAKAAMRMGHSVPTNEQEIRLNAGEVIGTVGTDDAVTQDGMIMDSFVVGDSAFLDSLFRDFGDGWSV